MVNSSTPPRASSGSVTGSPWSTLPQPTFPAGSPSRRLLLRLLNVSPPRPQAWLLTLPPAFLCRSFPSMQRFRASDSHRSLCTKLQPNVMPLNWRTELPHPPVRTHLPVDSLAHLTLPLLEGLSFAPLFPAHLLPREGGSLPLN